jgi:hypothetical protein
MRPAFRCVLAVIALLHAPAGFAQETTGAAPPTGKAAAPGPGSLTGKERLGRKWKDEQRIDNCKVPPNLRGSKPRPDACTDGPPAWIRGTEARRVHVGMSGRSMTGVDGAAELDPAQRQRQRHG